MANQNRRSKDYRACEAQLPEPIRQLAQKIFQLFEQNPGHPSLDLKELYDTKKGRHKKGSFRVKVSHQYRAIFFQDKGINVWYWVGTKNDFKNFTGVQG